MDHGRIAGVQRRCRETRRQRCLAGQRTAGPTGLFPVIGHGSGAVGLDAAAVKRHSPAGDNTLGRARFRNKGREDRDHHRVGIALIRAIRHGQREDIGHGRIAGVQRLRREGRIHNGRIAQVHRAAGPAHRTARPGPCTREFRSAHNEID